MAGGAARHAAETQESNPRMSTATAAELVAGTALGCQHAPAQGRRRGGASMRVLLRDIVLFSCLLAFVTGIVIAVASLLS
jgi:hypothetical protein